MVFVLVLLNTKLHSISKLSDCPNHLLCSLWLPVIESVLRPVSIPKLRVSVSSRYKLIGSQRLWQQLFKVCK